MLIVQTNSHIQMNRGKVNRPPPVPPRPNQNVVAEALAKTRKAITDSSVKSKNAIIEQKKTYVNIKDRDSSIPVPATNVSPKTNGLARVKSFIKDVISDRNSSDEKKLNSKINQKNSLNNGSATELSNSSHVLSKSKISASEPHSTNSFKIEKPSKLSKQTLVRSFSTSLKTEQERKIIKKDSSLEKNRVTKSSSFAEKSSALPLRKAPPPPLSPKPKLRRPDSKTSVNTEKRLSEPKELLSNKLVTREIETVSSPDNLETNLENDQPLDTDEVTYETINEVALSKYNDTVTTKQPTTTSPQLESPSSDSDINNKTRCVTEMLISEIIANKDKYDQNISVENTPMMNTDNMVLNGVTNTSTADDSDENRERRLKNLFNHEMLISELQSMRPDKIENDTVPYHEDEGIDNVDDESHNATHLYRKDEDLHSRLQKQFSSISNMSLQGLPPLPKSLSGFHEMDNFTDCDDERLDNLEVLDTVTVGDKPGRISMSLDTKLAVLKKEMVSLRRLDLSLLSELWTLNESMHEWRLRLERRSSGGRLRPAPPPPPRTPSPPSPASDHSNELDYPDSSA